MLTIPMFLHDPQFHPESIGTCFGREIFMNFREITEDHWLNYGPLLNSKENVDYSGKSSVVRDYFLVHLSLDLTHACALYAFDCLSWGELIFA